MICPRVLQAIEAERILLIIYTTLPQATAFDAKETAASETKDACPTNFVIDSVVKICDALLGGSAISLKTPFLVH